MDPAGALTRLNAVLLADPPPDFDVPAAIQSLGTNQIYRAPGAVAYFDEQKVRAALVPGMKLLVRPFGSADEPDELRQWTETTHTTLIEVAGLWVQAYDGGAFGPSDIPELRQQTAHYDVTSAVLGMINYKETGATSSDSLPADPVVPPTAAQVSQLAAQLRANPVYNDPGRADPLTIPTADLERKTSLKTRVVALPPLGPGQPLIDYAPALAKEFPGETVFVTYGMWLEVAGPDQRVLESARDYAYGRFEVATFQQGADMADRIGTVALRAADLLQRHPFARPQPSFDLRQTITGLAPWVLAGSALLLGGGSLAAWFRRRARAIRAERLTLQRETALTTAAIAKLDAGILADAGQPDTLAAVAERRSTATEMFERAKTAVAMREVREIAVQGRKILEGAA